MKRVERKTLVIVLVITLIGVAAGCTRNLTRGQLRIGVWAAEKGLWDEAVFRWTKAVTENPASAAAHNNLAVAYEKKGLREEAEKEYGTALKLAPDNGLIRMNYKRFQEAGKIRPQQKDEKN